MIEDCEGFSGTDKPIARQLLLRAQETQISQPPATGVLRKAHTSKSAKEALAEHGSTVSDRIDLQWVQLFTPIQTTRLTKKCTTAFDTKTRHVVVKNLYPRLLYSFSDVVCFVTNNSRYGRNSNLYIFDLTDGVLDQLTTFFRRCSNGQRKGMRKL